MTRDEYEAEVATVVRVLYGATRLTVDQFARELVELRAWKDSAVEGAVRWDEIVDLLAAHGHAGAVGDSRIEFVKRFVRRALTNEDAAREYQTASQ